MSMPLVHGLSCTQRFGANRASFRSRLIRPFFCVLQEGKGLPKAALLRKLQCDSHLDSRTYDGSSQITAIALFASSCPPKVGVL